MSFWKNWLWRSLLRNRKLSQRSASQKKRRRTFLLVDVLEDRIVLDSGGGAGQLSETVPYNSGALIPAVNIYPIFLEDTTEGNSEVSAAVQAELEAYFTNITTSGFIPNLLSQYNEPGYTLGNGTLEPADVNVQFASTTYTYVNLTTFAFDTAPAIDDSVIQTLIQQEITASRTGAQGPDNLYVVFTPPGDVVTTDGGILDGGADSIYVFDGYNNAFTDTDGNLDYYVVIPYPGDLNDTALTTAPAWPPTPTGYPPYTEGLSTLQQLTAVASQEVINAITDPDNSILDDDGTGWIDDSLDEQVADLCLYQYYTYDDNLVQYVWSNSAQEPEHTIGTGADDLFINQLSPPAIDISAGESVPIATFTDANAALTASDFTPIVFSADINSGTETQWTATVTGGNGHFVIDASPDSALADESVGTAFYGDGLDVGIYDNVDGTLYDGSPMSYRYEPFVVSASAPLTYNADDGGVAHNFVLEENGANFDLTDNGLLVFTQPIADTTSIDIGADSGGTVDSSLTIDYSGGVFNLPVTFDGGNGSGVHNLIFTGGSAANDTITPTSANAFTLNGQMFTVSNVTSVVDLDAVPILDIDDNTGNNQLNVVNGPTVSSTATIELTSSGGAIPAISFANQGSVNIDDSGGPDTFTVNASADAAGLTTLNLLGSTGNDAFNVQATPAGLTTILNGGGGSDTATIGSVAPLSGGTLAGIDGPVEVGNSGGGQTALTIDDSGDSTAQSSATLDTTTSGGQTFGELLDLGNSAAINWDIDDLTSDNDVSSVTINGGSGGNTIQVGGTDAAASAYTLTLNSGNGNDTVTVAPQPLNTNLTVNGQLPYPALGNTLIYTGSPTDPLVSGSGTIMQSGYATVNYTNFATIGGQQVPMVTSINPASGVTTGGTVVTITGTNFTGATGVSFSGAPASFTFVSATEITAIAPAHAAGMVDITVTGPGGTSSMTPGDEYTYEAAPTVTAVFPTTVSTLGGTVITVTGTNFTGATAVDFNGTPATSFTFVSPSEITATAPAHAAGIVDVTVTAVGGTSSTSAADEVTYAAPPVITAINPNSGLTGGGTFVTITGSGFTGATVVDFGLTAAASFSVISATEITATSPPEAAGTVDITVTNAVATSTTSAADKFTFGTQQAATVVFVTEPNSALAGATLAPVTVQVFDQFGDVISGASVNLGVSSGTITGGGSLITNAQGEVVYSGLVETVAGTYTLTATAGTISASSSTFMISPGPVADVVFLSQPSSTTAGSTISQVTVDVTDQYGNSISGATVSIAISPGALTSGGAPLVSNGAGQVVFGSLTETTAGTYSLTASVGGISTPSNSFVITAAAAAKLTYLSQPSSTGAGSIISPVTVKVSDQYGNGVANVTVGIALSSGSLTSGTTPLTTSNAGQVVFGDLSELQAGTYTLTASSAGLASISSASFIIVPSFSSSEITFVGQPSGTTVGSPLYPVTVKATDQFGNVLTGAEIDMSISSGTLATGAGPITVNSLGEAVFIDLTDTVSGTYTLTASILGGASASSNIFVLTPAAPSVLTFLTQPASTTAGSGLGTITVQVADKYGNPVYGGIVDMKISSGVLSSGTLAAYTNVAGQATFTNLSENTAGTYMLLASTSGTSSFDSSTFVISPASASAVLSFVNQPSGVLAGAVFSAITVKEADAYGNVLIGVPVSIGLVAGTLTTGTTPITTNSAGRAVFSDLTETTSGSYTLTASAVGLTSVNSNGFSVLAGSAAHLAFAVSPTGTSAGSSLGGVTVQAADKYGNPVAGVAISLGLSPGKLSGGTTAAASNSAGQASFSNLLEDTAGTYSLTATATGLSALSSSFVISPAAVARLTFVSEPTATAAGNVINPITVKALDVYGNAENGAVVKIALSSGALTSGTTPLTAGATGEVVFNDLTETKSGTYALDATVSGLASVSSSLFAVTAAPASTVTFLSQPNSIAAGGNLGSVTVQVEDQYGNPVSGNVVTITMPSGTLSGTATVVTGTTGLAIFSILTTKSAGTFALNATVAGLASTPSNTFVVSPLAASKLSILTEPATTSAGSTINAITVQAVDSLGNGVSGVVVGIAISPGTLSGGTTPLTTNASGDAVFSDLDETVAGTYTLTASATGLTSVRTSSFVVSAAAISTLSFTSQPTSATAGSILSAVVVKAVDAFGNLESGKTVTMSISSGSLSGTTIAVTNSLGLATFSSLSVPTGGADTLTATSGSASAVSSVFAVISGADTLSFTGEPASAAAGASLGSVTVTADDASGNPLPGVAVTVSLAAATLSGTLSATTNAVGQAIFSSLSVAAVGTYTLTASSKGLSNISSSSFVITGATAAKLSFMTQPSTVGAGNTFNPVTLKVVDAYGNPVSGTLITIALSSGTLSGATTVVSSSSGLAVFSTLSTTTGGVETLIASVPGLTSVDSNSFTVTGGASTAYSFLSEPQSTVAGTILSPITLQVVDQYGNGVAGVAISLKTSINTVNGTTTLTTSASGLAVFSNLEFTKTGTYTLTATAGSLGQLASTTFTITPAKGYLSFVNQPLSTNTANLLGPITVAVLDQYGNAVPGTAVTMHSSTGALGGITVATTNAAGQAVFSTLTLAQTGTYSLSATASGLTSLSSSKFAITAATDKLAFSTPPTTASVGVAMSPVVVQLYSSTGAVLAEANVAVTVKLTSGTLTGTLTVYTNSSGQAIFSNLIIGVAGTYMMTASASVSGQPIGTATGPFSAF